MKTKEIVGTIIFLILQFVTVSFSATHGNDKVGIPNLNVPSNGVLIDDDTLYFEWDDVAGATRYRLIVDNNIYFSGPEISLDTLKSSNYTTSSSLINGTYYWRVGAKDSQDTWGYWSSIGKFTFSTVGRLVDEMVLVDGGTFKMGSDEGFPDDRPVHEVTLSSYYISKYEVTNSQFCEFLNAVNVSSKGKLKLKDYIKMDDFHCQIAYTNETFVPKDGKEDYPVFMVSWSGAEAFCEWAGGRLPTEAEWEYAARGGQKSGGFTYSGSNNVDSVGWYKSNSHNPDNNMFEGKGTHPVGQKMPNELGLHDMSGNVWEWCNDWLGSYDTPPQIDPQGPDGGLGKILRGGHWHDKAPNLRVTLRYAHPSWNMSFIAGFRICMSR